MDSTDPEKRTGRLVPKWSGTKPAAARPSKPAAPTNKVELTSGAIEQLAALPKKIQRQIGEKIDLLKMDATPPGSKKLQGASGFYRLKSGEYRIVYAIEKNGTIVVTVVRIRHRKDVYENL